MSNWDKVREACQTAVSVSFDGCHKIYLSMDKPQHDYMVELGYEPVLIVDDPQATPVDDNEVDRADAYLYVRDLYSLSCSLRFVEAVRTVNGDVMCNDGFTSLVPQFDDEVAV